MIISGAIIPVGVKNKNGWGILDSEILNVINTLKGKPLTICPRNGEPHACDYDPKSEIGQITEAWYDPFENKIRTMAKVTDSVAKTKIGEGTWQKNWSVRITAAETKDGWAHGTEAKNVTLVPNGAWPEANFDVLASKGDGFEAVLLASFESSAPDASATPSENEQTASQSSDSPPADESEGEGDKNFTGGQDMTDTPDFKELLAAKDVEIDGLKQELTNLKASQAQMGEDIVQKAKELAAAEVTAYKESLARETAINDYVAAATERGVETVDTKMFEGLKSEQITALTASLKSIPAPTVDSDKVAAKYPAKRAQTAEEQGGLSVGIPDGKGGHITEMK
jgi:hypothetical protein